MCGGNVTVSLDICFMYTETKSTKVLILHSIWEKLNNKNLHISFYHLFVVCLKYLHAVLYQAIFLTFCVLWIFLCGNLPLIIIWHKQHSPQSIHLPLHWLWPNSHLKKSFGPSWWCILLLVNFLVSTVDKIQSLSLQDVHLQTYLCLWLLKGLKDWNIYCA